MSFEAKKWQETEGPCLRNFDEKEAIESVQGALALRPQIEAVIDRIWEEGFDGIYFIGIGGTYASAMQVEVYMRGRSSLPIYVENAAEFLTTGNRRFTERSVVKQRNSWAFPTERSPVGRQERICLTSVCWWRLPNFMASAFRN